MEIIKDDKLDSDFKITLGILFPRKFCNNLKKYLSAEQFNIYLKNKKNIEMQKVLVQMLVEDDYRIFKGTDIISKTAGQFNKYYNRAAEAKLYKYVTDRVFNQAKLGEYNFYSLPFIQNLKQNLKNIFQVFPEDYTEEYSNDIKEFLNTYFIKLDIPKDYIDNLCNCDFLDQITCLTAIALTWPSWNDKKTATDLSYFLIPQKVVNSDTDFEKNQSILDYIANEKRDAKNKLEHAKNLYDKSRFKAAAECFLQVTHINLADDEILGDAYYYLALCILDHSNDDIKKIFNKILPIDLLKKARDFGHVSAQKRLDVENVEPTPIDLIKKLPDFPDDQEKPNIILNSKNKYTEIFMKSLPKEMKERTEKKQMVKYCYSKDSMINELRLIDQKKDYRFLLFDNNPEKNFHDLLYILDYISSFEKAKNSISALFHWHKISVYIRLNESEYSALIDTALKRLGDFTIRVFIIDDNKWTAQYLLYQHPLFKPIQYIPANKLQNGAVALNFTIICDQNLDLSCWLIREAYWLGCFHYAGITLSINVVSPNASKIESKLRYDCPGIFGQIPDINFTSKVKIDKDSFRDIKSITSDDAFCALTDCKNKTIKNNYYVINIGNSIENLNFAIKLREWTIRELIDSKKRLQNSSLPLISFYCPDSSIGHLSQHLVVQNVSSGDQWFNNYNLIPFGSLDSRYSWNQLDGGYLEDVAESTHLQYCNVDHSVKSEEKLLALKSYFSRSYNRDSSMAVALSMPYRLFQVNVGETGHILSLDKSIQPHIPPKDIDKLANTFRKALTSSDNQKDNKQNLLMYEHSRWLRWAISRGWKSASSEQVINYMKYGNPKQQLYIARLHGCICSLKELEHLSNELCEQAYLVNDSETNRYAEKREIVYGAIHFKPKNFLAIDESNIEATSDIIKTSWFPIENLLNEIDDLEK